MKERIEIVRICPLEPVEEERSGATGNAQGSERSHLWHHP